MSIPKNRVQCLAPCPVLNRPDFESLFARDSLPLDEKGHFRPLEFIALPGTEMSIETRYEGGVCKVDIPSYPGDHLYVDEHLLSREGVPKIQQGDVLEQLRNAIGLPYLWGGNCFEEVEIYGHVLKGVDCSGLLYAATAGFTPRNTSELLEFGQPIDTLQPLDLIVWPGHVVIVYSDEEIIESRESCGVILTPLDTRVAEIFEKHPGVTMRRWMQKNN